MITLQTKMQIAASLLQTIVLEIVNQIQNLYLQLKQNLVNLLLQIYLLFFRTVQKVKNLFTKKYSETKDSVDELIVEKSVVLQQRIGVNLLEWSRFHNKAILSSYLASKFYFLHNFFTIFNFDISGKILVYKKAAKKISSKIKRVWDNYNFDNLKTVLFAIIGFFSGTICFIIYYRLV